MGVSRSIGLALITLRVTETVKEALPVIPPPAPKSAFVIALSIGLSVAAGERDPLKAVGEGIAVAGLASILHDAQEAAKRFTDNQIAGVITRTPRRAAPLGA